MAAKKSPDLKVIMRTVADLVPYIRNARTHSDEQVAQIAASIKEFGWTSPILIDGDNGIIAGHGRVMAARKLAMATVPCIELSGLSDTQKRAYIIMDNKSALNAGWDIELLALEFEDLKLADFDLDMTGFSLDEIASLIPEEIAPGEDGKESGNGKLSDRFMLPPFSVLNAREGWWQDRKRAWLALGIKSELGRGGGADDGGRASNITGAELLPRREKAAPGGSARPACDYSKKQRGNGAGRPIE